MRWRRASLLRWVSISVHRRFYPLTISATEDDRAQRALNKAKKKPDKVAFFRGIHFDEWLRVFMQVPCSAFLRIYAILIWIGWTVRVRSDET